MATPPERDQSEALIQQTALAQFGYFALQSDSLDDILQEACRLVCMGLKTDHSKVMELTEDGSSFLVRAGVHWKDGIIGSHIEPRTLLRSDGYTLSTGQPTLSSNLETEDRFDVPPFVKEHGVKAFVNVIIVGPRGKTPYGILEVDDDEPRDFRQSDIDFLKTYANLIAAAVERLRIEEELRKTIQIRERLLVELQHRIKNSLQMVTSLVTMKRRRAALPDTRIELQGIEFRIESLRVLYDKLYSAGEVDRVDLAPYLAELSGGLLRFHGEAVNKIKLRTELNSVVVPTDTAIPLGLIVNEFMTNSLKYAFPDGTGTIGIELTPLDGHARLTLWDDGAGFPPGEKPSGTGLGLINGLATQVEATVSWVAGKGARLELTLPKIPSTISLGLRPKS